MDVRDGIESKVVRADPYVADVAQKLAIRPMHQFGKEFGFRHCGILETHIVRWVFQEIWPAKQLLDFGNILCHDSHGFGVVGHRQEVIEVLASIRGPREMTGNEDRINTIQESLHSS